MMTNLKVARLSTVQNLLAWYLHDDKALQMSEAAVSIL